MLGLADSVRGETVRNEELADLLTRREVAGLLPAAATIVELARQWVSQGLLPVEAVSEIVARLVENGRLSREELGDRLLGGARAATLQTHPEWQNHLLQRVVQRLATAPVSDVAWLAGVVARWAKAGVLPPEACCIAGQEITKLELAGRLDPGTGPEASDNARAVERLKALLFPNAPAPASGLLTGRSLPALAERRRQGALLPAPADLPDEQAARLTEEMREGLQGHARDGSLPGEAVLLELFSRQTSDSLATVQQLRANAGPLPPDEARMLVVEALVLEALFRDATAGDLVGLALSGGGIRSASFNFGLLQAFHEKGLLPHVDYLSTVSGGGYIGSWHSSQVLRPEDGASPPESGPDAEFTLALEPGGKLPDRALRLVRNGKYLSQPLMFANRYLIGLILINLVLISGLVFLATFIAGLWRLLDTSPICEWLKVNIGDWLLDWNRPFLPACILLLCWLLTLMASYYLRSNAPGWKKQLMALLLLALLAQALIAGVGFAFLPPEPVKAFLYLFAILAFAWFLLLGVAKVRASRTHPLEKSTQVLLCLVGGSALVGLAVCFSNPNINLERPALWDQKDLPVQATSLSTHREFLMYLAIAGGAALLPLLRPWRLLESGTKPKTWAHRWIFRVTSLMLVIGMPLALIFFISRHNFSGHNDERGPDFYFTDIRKWHVFWETVEDQHHDYYTDSNAAAAPGAWIWDRLDPATQHKLRETTRSRVAPHQHDFSHHHPPAQDDRARELWRKYQEPIPFEKSILESKQALVADFNAAVIGAARFPTPGGGVACGCAVGVWKETPAEKGLFANATQQGHDPDRLIPLRERNFLSLFDDAWVKKQVASLKTGDAKQVEDGQTLQSLWDEWRHGRIQPEDQARLHRLLVEAKYPNEIWERSRVRRSVVIAADQWHRLLWLGISLSLFVAFAFLVSLNDTSLHGFYRDRLAEGYIRPDAHGRHDVPLKDLDTVRHGAPYHLISTTLHQLPAGFKDGFLTLLGVQAWNDEQWNELFLMSRRYCGSDATQFRRTDDYLGGELGLADAMAISGAAVSPVQMNNPLICLTMTILNLRLGQWLPNPRRAGIRGQPTIIGLLGSLFRAPENRGYCFVSDGGHLENLGLEPLLRRRCKLIVVSDAGHDEEHAFADLVKVYRRARILDGTQLRSFDREDFARLDPLLLNDKKECSAHSCLARITYPDQTTGLLIYLKPSFTGDEEIDLQRYREGHPNFPHDPTSDQLYDEYQVEAYRQLGHHIGMKLCEKLRPEDWASYPTGGAGLERLREAGPAPTPTPPTPLPVPPAVAAPQATGAPVSA